MKPMTSKEFYLSELQKNNPTYYEYVRQTQTFKEHVEGFSEEQKKKIENTIAESVIKELSLSCKQ